MNEQLTLALQINDEATFTDFCWGENILLQHKIQQIIAGCGERALYCWGPAGSGKSHLLQACCQSVRSGRAAIYLPLGIVKECGPAILDDLELQSFIAIDDIDVIAAEPDWEEALLHLYNRIRDNGETTLIITSTLSPAEAPIRLPDLRSRLSWGLVMQLYPLNDADKIGTLQRVAQKRGFELSAHVGQFLLNRCARNMRDLHLLLDRLDVASLAAQRKITIPFVKAVLGI